MMPPRGFRWLFRNPFRPGGVIPAIQKFAPSDIPRLEAATLAARVLGGALVLALVVWLTSGLIPSLQGSRVLVGWLALTVLTLLSALLGWPLGRLAGHLRKRPPEATGSSVAARWVAGAAALAAVAFLLGLAWTILRTMRSSPFVLAFGVPGWAEPLFVIPWVVLVLGVAALALAAAAWRRGWWSASAGAHYTAVSLACLNFVGILVYFHFF